jgi:hypothetical protein
MTVEFKFNVDQRVRVPFFGAMGIISMLGYDDNGIVYYVKIQGGGNWFKEKDIEPYESI